MPVWMAVSIITWIALLLMFFALATVVRDVRLLRSQINRDATEFAAARVALQLPGPVGHDGGIVLAADVGCPLCLATAIRLGELAERVSPARVSLLTYDE